MTEKPEPRYQVTVERTSAGTFVARNLRGGEVRFSTGEDGGFAVELLLAAIAGCSSIDVDTFVTRRAEPSLSLSSPPRRVSATATRPVPRTRHTST